MENPVSPQNAVSNVDQFIETKYASLEAIMTAISSTTVQLVMAEFLRILNDKNVQAHIEEVMPYMYVAALLSLSGNEIDKESISKVMNAIKVEPNEEIIQILLNTNVKSHLGYVYAYYFLLAMGKNGSEEEMLSIVEALGIEPDAKRMEDILKYLSSPGGAKKV